MKTLDVRGYIVLRSILSFRQHKVVFVHKIPGPSKSFTVITIRRLLCPRTTLKRWHINCGSSNTAILDEGYVGLRNKNVYRCKILESFMYKWKACCRVMLLIPDVCRNGRPLGSIVPALQIPVVPTQILGRVRLSEF